MEEDLEWEYEYDENETEDLYFTLDLTTHVPDAVPVAKTSRNGKTVPKLAPPIREETILQPGSLQILDLHTRNPFVKFNDGVYSCRWHTDLGTQVHVAEQGAIADPVRKGHVLDIVGTSQTRLLAEPVTLKPLEGQIHLTGERNGALASPDGEAGASPAQPLPPSDLSTLRPGQQLVVPPEAVKNPVMAAQASFFERLSAIKLAKGENDIIPVGAVKFYAPPADKDEIRQRAFAAAGQQESAASMVTPYAQPKGKGKKRTHDDMVDSPRASTSAAAKNSSPATRPRSRQTSTHEPTRSSSSTVQYALPGQDLSVEMTSSHQIRPRTTPQPSPRAHQHFSPVPYSLPSSLTPQEPLGPTIPWHAMPHPAQGISSINSPQSPLTHQSQEGGALVDILRQPEQHVPTAGPSATRRPSSKGSGTARAPD